MDNYFEMVLSFLQDHTDKDLSSCTKDTKLAEDIGFNSLELMNIANDAEDEFDIIIEDDELKNIRTIDDLVNILINKKN